MSLERKEIFEFGEFRLDANEHTIERIDGTPNGTLPEKAFRALVLLIRRRGHLVPKDELIEYVWPDTIVEDNNLEKCVHHIRHFLGETSDGKNYIQTVRKHGYRFVGRVNVVEVSGTWLPEAFRADNGKNGVEGPLADAVAGRETGDASEQAAETIQDPSLSVSDQKTSNSHQITRRRKGLLRGSKFLLRGLGIWFGFLILFRILQILTVLLFNYSENLSKSGSKQFTGIVVDLLVMVEIPIGLGLFVGIGTFLFGFARIFYALFEKANSKIKSLTIERVFVAVICLILLSIGIPNLMYSYREANRARQINQEQATRGTSNEEAYGLYQQGMYLIDKRRPGNSVKALDYLEQAVALDPNYAQAWAGKALAVRTTGGRDENQNHRVATEAIRNALALNPNLSDAYTASCNEKLLYDYAFVEAETACKHAIDLDPSSSTAHRAYSWVLSFHGKHDAALAEIATAIDLEPVSYINKRDLGNALYIARRYDEAAAQWRRLVDLDATDPVVYNQLIRTLEAHGKEGEAFEWLIKYLNVQKSDEHVIARYQAAYQNSGWRGVLLERATDPNKGFGYETDFHIAGLYAQAGEKDKAFEHLERSFQQREWSMPQLQVYPQFDSIRDDPRYADLIRRIGLTSD